MSEQETIKATGSFEVELNPQLVRDNFDEDRFSQMAIRKTISGDIEGTSQGLMLAIRTAVPDSAGYVAIELIEGTLAGRSGSFVLQHSSFMDRGVPQQDLRVVPDSGTGELEGISGTMIIDIEAEGNHSYEFNWQLD